MEKKLAYIILETEKNEQGEYIPCIVKEGESGYYRTDWTWGKDQLIAQEIADDRNNRMGLSPTDVMQLTLESMREDINKLKTTTENIRYFRQGKTCQPDEADEVIVSTFDDKGNLLSEERHIRSQKEAQK